MSLSIFNREISSTVLNKDQKDGIDAQAFFGRSTYLDILALKPLSHIHPYWEITWDSKNSLYIPEENSFAEELNEVLAELNRIIPPDDYHKYEDRVIKQIQKQSNKKLFKLKGEWVEFMKNKIIKKEYDYLLKQGQSIYPTQINSQSSKIAYQGWIYYKELDNRKGQKERW